VLIASFQAPRRAAPIKTPPDEAALVVHHITLQGRLLSAGPPMAGDGMRMDKWSGKNHPAWLQFGSSLSRPPRIGAGRAPSVSNANIAPLMK
jgi:hypothetical protein